jgi:hypothetical protein
MVEDLSFKRNSRVAYIPTFLIFLTCSAIWLALCARLMTATVLLPGIFEIEFKRGRKTVMQRQKTCITGDFTNKKYLLI